MKNLIKCCNEAVSQNGSPTEGDQTVHALKSGHGRPSM